jgi:transcription-repair coupling factor (superfamily II helicase)
MSVSRETPTLSVPAFLRRFASHPFSKVLAGLEIISLNQFPIPVIGIYLLSQFPGSDRNKLLALCDSGKSAENLYRFCFNLKPNSVFYYPADDDDRFTIPGFNLELERYRSEALYFIRKSDQGGLIISTDEASAAELIDPDPPNADQDYSIRAGSSMDRSSFLDDLQKWGYVQEEVTVSPKTFSVRGGIVDLFPLHSTYPVRIEFFGSQVESMRLFNPLSQRMIQSIEIIDVYPPISISEKEDRKLALINCLDPTVRQFRIANDSKAFDSDVQPPILFETIKHLDQDRLKENGVLVVDNKELKTNENTFFLFVENDRQQKNLESLLQNNVLYVKGLLERGFFVREYALCISSYTEIFNHLPEIKTRWGMEATALLPQQAFSSLDDLRWNDFLVHKDFGVGRFRGLIMMETQKGIQQECIKVEYAEGSFVYVPIDRFDKIHKLVSTGDRDPTLSSLRSSRWNIQVRRARQSAREIVKDLVLLYSARSKKRGFQYDKNDRFYDALVASFPYAETPDQQSATETVVQDMEGSFPMDRLICGDVGFGKTEVALRAAVKAIASGKKVLFLTPTTILADQHYISTYSRFNDLGLRVELLSRFKTRKEQRSIIEQMEKGFVDIVIGTHRLLQDDVQFPDLGLLIIDEEHRFGVKHKEKLKHLKNTVDVLTLSATPIPRTLQQAIIGIRDVSRIATPPKARKPIRTYVQYFNWDRIKAAIQHELDRNGQVYFLHNTISQLPFYHEKLSALFPDHAVAVATGQMKSRELEKIILGFFSNKIDILICTTIIESGLDVSNANTIIINGAHQFGLSQLYQIRGRVGRSYRQAYCYLLIPHGISLGTDALHRLKAIEQYTSLGSGFEIATKDLEIRGAGNMFGYKQSGHIAAVGFEMYCSLLQEALLESRQDQSTSVAEPVKINLDLPATLDSSYVPLVQDRLYFYQQIAEVNSPDQIQDLRFELMDRFGPLPTAAENLFLTLRYRISFYSSSVTSVDIKSNSVLITLKEIKPFPTMEEFLQKLSREVTRIDLSYHVKPVKDQVLVIHFQTGSRDQSIQVADIFVSLFSLSIVA